MINIAAGFVGAILGGWFGAYWAMTQSSQTYRVIDTDASLYHRCEWLDGWTLQQLIERDSPDRGAAGACKPFLGYDWDWFLVAPATLAAAIVGAMIVLIGVGILRKLYR